MTTLVLIRGFSAKALQSLAHNNPTLASNIFLARKQYNPANFNSDRPLSISSLLGSVSSKDLENNNEFLKYKLGASSAPKHFNENAKSKDLISVAQDNNEKDYLLPHPIWSKAEVDEVEISHREPKGFTDRCAYGAVMLLRTSFDFASGYTIGKQMKTLDERSVLIRCIFLETVAGTLSLAILLVVLGLLKLIVLFLHLELAYCSL